MNPALKFERSFKEYTILGLSLCCIFALVPFVILRLATQDWHIAFLDLALVLVSTWVFVSTLKTRKTNQASIILSSMFIAGEIATVAIRGDVQFYWVYPCTVGVYFLMPIARALIMNGFAMIVLVTLLYGSFENLERASFILSLAATNIFTVIFSIRVGIQKKQLEDLSLIDPLTGIASRGAFEIFLDKMTKRREDLKHDLSMIVFDVDKLEKVNQIQGRAASDEVLRKILTLISTQLHSHEKVYRLRDKECAIAPIMMNLNDTFDLAERLRKIVEYSNQHKAMGITISLGVADYKLDESPQAWELRAGEAMQEAIKAGRNRTYRLP